MSRSTDPSPPQTALVTPHYAPASLALPWYRQRSFRRGIAGVVLILIGLVLSYVYRDLPRNWRLARLQDKCLVYTAPSDQIVYSELPADIAKLPASSSEYSIDLSVAPSSVLRRPNCWLDFSAVASGSSPAAYPVIFLGERSNAGQRRLICLQFSGFAQKPPSWPPRDPGLYVVAGPSFLMNSYDVARYNGAPRRTGWWSGECAFAQSPPELIKNLRFFAGQSDPKDSSRFTIAYEANDKTGTLEGRLESDGSVSVRIVDGPLKASHPAFPAGRLVP